MEDRIERELELRAPIERVWQVITDPAYAAPWFGGRAEFDLRVGGAAVFGWPEEGMGDFHGVVERVEPPREFAFRWMHDAGVPVGAAAVSTLVEFSLSPAGDGTRLRLVESGSTDETHRKENAQGWDAELADLVALLADA